MKVRELLGKLDLGNSVAEFDAALEKYFVETETFRALIEGRADIVAGDKGTGKTAIFRILARRYTQLPELKGTEVVTGFNATGNPVFQRLARQGVLTEGQYTSVWKAYVFSLVGNWLLDLYDTGRTDHLKRIDELLTQTQLRSLDDSPQTIFSKITNAVSRFLTPRAAEARFTLSETGIPIVTPRVEFGGDTQPADAAVESVPHEEALGLLNACLAESDLTIWVVLDRLDEAFQGFPDTEAPALRALFRTYLDLLEFDQLKLKVFVRRDLFRRIVRGGFVNLTHVNARKIEIVWDEDDLKNLLCRRIRENTEVVEAVGVKDCDDAEVFDALFPPQVDVGERKPTTWAWMMSRIRDGNNAKPPRNLVDLVTKAKEAQLRSEDRTSRDHAAGVPLFEADALRRALSRLSSERVEDTLLAEAGEAAETLERFRGGKAEHNDASLGALLGVAPDQVKAAAQSLVEIGFLEPVGGSYKVPMLYRDGLEITQGKAF